MKIYRISNSIQDVESWLETYLLNNGGEESCTFGGCNDLVDSMYFTFGKNDPTWERWGLYSFYDNKISDKLPHIADANEVRQAIGDNDLCDVAWEHHDVAKLQGYYWDGKGKHNSLDEITFYFDKVKNSVWIRTE